MVNYLRLCIIACSLLLANACFAINKCTDAQGQVSYQDRPCTGSSKSQALNLPNDKSSSINNKVFWYPLHLTQSVNTLGLLMKGDWVVMDKSQNNPKNMQLSVIKSKDNSFKINISYIQARQVSPASLNLSAQAAFNAMRTSFGSQLSQPSQLTAVGDGKIQGFLFQAADPKWLGKQPASGEYANMMQAIMQVGNGRLVYTVLFNQARSADYLAALTAINTLRLNRTPFNTAFREMTLALDKTSSIAEENAVVDGFFSKMENADPQSQFLIGLWALPVDKAIAKRWLTKSAGAAYKPALMKLVELTLLAQ